MRDVRYDHYDRGDGWWVKDTAMIWPDRGVLEAYLATWRGSGASREIVWLDQPAVPAIKGWAVRDKWGQYDTGPRWGCWSHQASRALIHATRAEAEAACFKGEGYAVVELSWPPQQNTEVRHGA